MKKILCIIIAVCLLMSSSIAFASSGGASGAQQREKEIKSLSAQLKKHFGDQKKRKELIKKIVELKKKNDKNKSKDPEENLYYVYADAKGEIFCVKSSIIKYFDKANNIKYVIPRTPIEKGLGATLTWDPVAHTITVSKGETHATIDLDTPPSAIAKTKSNRAIVLVKYIANLLGYRTDTDGEVVIIDRPSTSNVALGKSVIASSQETGKNNLASHGNDGNTTTRWCAADGSEGQWWKVDLNGFYNLTGTKVKWESNKIYGYMIQVSSDDSNWTTVVDKRNNTSSAQVNVDNFTQNAANSVKFVKITITGLEQGSWASFYEFEVFGSRTSTADTQAPTTPSNLTAAAITNSQVNLSWTASTDNTAVVKYRIYRDDVPITEVTAGTAYQDKNLDGGKIYKYNVSAIDAAGNESPKSIQSAVSVPELFSINDNTLGTDLNQFKYTGNWLYTNTEVNAFQGDNHWSGNAGDCYEVRFYGTGFKLYAAIAPNHGMAKITIDGIITNNVDLDFYAATRTDNTLVYTSPILASGSHTLKVEVTGTKNGSAGNCFIPADRVEIIN